MTEIPTLMELFLLLGDLEVVHLVQEILTRTHLYQMYGDHLLQVITMEAER